MILAMMAYGQKEKIFGAQDKNTTVHWKSEKVYVNILL